MGCALLGRALLAVGRTAEARQHLDRAVGAAQALDAHWHESLALCWLAQVDRDTGHLTRGLSRAHRTLGLMSTDASEHRADTLVLLGTIHRRLGQPEEALDFHRRALAVTRTVRAKRPELEALVGLATAYNDLARTEPAMRCANLAYAIARRTGYRVLEGLALTCLAGIALATNDNGAAIRRGAEALAIHQRTGYRLGQADTHVILEHALRIAGRPDESREHRQRALDCYRAVGAHDEDNEHDRHDQQ